MIQNLSYHITGRLSAPLPEEWNAFNRSFNEGTYYHYRCQGYVECFRATNAYSNYSVNLWINELVYPAAKNFKQAMMDLEQLKANTTVAELQEFKILQQQIQEFQQIAMVIIQNANHLNTTTAPLKM
ncbi:hypothetical protein ACFSFY_14680 [Sporosarcina siberiensis]|uniref:Uncharacterized protein n=1 Tax=Sporosarcina siberiensis TaxID=1365606 RepID=A0ABW4SIE1_9BACL